MQKLLYRGKAANMTPGRAYDIVKSRISPAGQKQGKRHQVLNDLGKAQWVAASKFTQHEFMATDQPAPAPAPAPLPAEAHSPAPAPLPTEAPAPAPAPGKKRLRQSYADFHYKVKCIIPGHKKQLTKTFNRLTDALAFAGLKQHYHAALKAIQRNQTWHQLESNFVVTKTNYEPHRKPHTTKAG